MGAAENFAQGSTGDDLGTEGPTRRRKLEGPERQEGWGLTGLRQRYLYGDWGLCSRKTNKVKR